VVESGTPESAQLEVPDLVGLNAAIALEELRMAGFTNIQLGSVDEDDTVVLAASNWTVVEQSAVPGAVQTSSDLIVLSCTKE
jgi:beta-lactam-binding protein with PASTA domain